MNTDAMITTLGRRWRDPSFNVKSRTDWLVYLNKAYRKFIKRSKMPMSSAYVDIDFSAGDASKSLSGLFGVESVYDLTNEVPLYPLYSRDQRAHLFNLEEGAVEAFAVEDNDIFLYAIPRTALSIRVLGYSEIADLTDAAAESVLPEHYHHALMDGALELAFRDDQNAELAQVYKADFNEAIEDALREFSRPKGGRLVPLRNDYFSVGENPWQT